MRAGPEPTQLEYLSDASFLRKLLVFPSNVRLDWKVIASYKHSSLFGLMESEEGKKFYNIDTSTFMAGNVSPPPINQNDTIFSPFYSFSVSVQCYKTFYVRNL